MCPDSRKLVYGKSKVGKAILMKPVLIPRQFMGSPAMVKREGENFLRWSLQNFTFLGSFKIITFIEFKKIEVYFMTYLRFGKRIPTIDLEDRHLFIPLESNENDKKFNWFQSWRGSSVNAQLFDCL